MALTRQIVTRFSERETAELEARAAQAGMPLRRYIRTTVMKDPGLSEAARLILVEQGKTREIVGRLMAILCSDKNLVAATGKADGRLYRQIESEVESMNPEIFIQRAMKGKA